MIQWSLFSLLVMVCYFIHVSNEIISEITGYLDVKSLVLLSQCSKDLLSRLVQNVRTLTNANNEFKVDLKRLQYWLDASITNPVSMPSAFNVLKNLCVIQLVSPCGRDAISNVPFIQRFGKCLVEGCIPNVQQLLIDINTADISLGGYRSLLEYKHDYDFIHCVGTAAVLGYCNNLQACTISISRQGSIYDDAEFDSNSYKAILLTVMFNHIASHCTKLAIFNGNINFYLEYIIDSPNFIILII